MFDNSSTVVLNNKTVSSIMQGNNVLYQKQTLNPISNYRIIIPTGCKVIDSQGNVVVPTDNEFQGDCGETYRIAHASISYVYLTVRNDNIPGYYRVTLNESSNGEVFTINFVGD